MDFILVFSSYVKKIVVSEFVNCFIVSVILGPLFKLLVSHRFRRAFIFFLGETAVAFKVYLFRF